jgi:hypothetical protein
MFSEKLTALGFAAFLASALTISLTPANAQKHGGGSSGHGGESAHSDSGDCGGCSGGDEGGGKGGKGGHGQRGGRHTGDAARGQSLRDIFHGLDVPSITERVGSPARGGPQ